MSRSRSLAHSSGMEDRISRSKGIKVRVCWVPGVGSGLWMIGQSVIKTGLDLGLGKSEGGFREK